MHFLRHFLSAIGFMVALTFANSALEHHQMHGTPGDLVFILLAALVYAVVRTSREKAAPPPARALSQTGSALVVLAIAVGGLILANRHQNGRSGGTYSGPSQVYADEASLLQGFLSANDYLVRHGFQPSGLPADEPFAGMTGLRSNGMQTFYYQEADSPSPLKMSIAVHPQGRMVIVSYDAYSRTRAEADELAQRGKILLNTVNHVLAAQPGYEPTRRAGRKVAAQ